MGKSNRLQSMGNSEVSRPLKIHGVEGTPHLYLSNPSFFGICPSSSNTFASGPI